jgi:hypothetical protein
MEMKMKKSIYIKDKVNFSYFFLLSRIDNLAEVPSIDNCIEDDLNEICDMTYSIKRMNEFSFIEI